MEFELATEKANVANTGRIRGSMLNEQAIQGFTIYIKSLQAIHIKSLQEQQNVLKLEKREEDDRNYGHFNAFFKLKECKRRYCLLSHSHHVNIYLIFSAPTGNQSQSYIVSLSWYESTGASAHGHTHTHTHFPPFLHKRQHVICSVLQPVFF